MHYNDILLNGMYCFNKVEVTISVSFVFIFVPCRIMSHMSGFMRKSDFCICKNKAADQLCSNCTADQRLCFCYMDSTIPLLLKSKISSFQPVSVTVQPSLCRTCSETTLLVFPRGGSNVYLDQQGQIWSPQYLNGRTVIGKIL